MHTKAGCSMELQGELSEQRTTDEELVQRCVAGDPEAWSSLVRKYANLIFSIPIKYGMSREDAADIFQDVCLTLLQELPRLREPKTLAAWLIKVTSHRCLRAISKTRTRGNMSPELATLPAPIAVADDPLLELRREQLLREVLGECSGRCRELIEMLFFTSPAVPYEKVAETLGVATGSIGFIRMRCLERLRRELAARGLK
jgi:RNA polymerase sigma factor (sigma-70 family)